MAGIGPNSTNINHSAAFEEALQRAREIAAKIQPSGQKRPLEDGGDGIGSDVKGPPGVGDGGPVFMGGGQPVQPPMGVPGGMPGFGMAPGGMPGGGMHREEIKVPDNMVGLIIGKGGEQITRILRESGAKVQIAQDSGGMPERACTISGAQDAINHAKEMIFEVVSQGNQVGRPGMGGGGGGGGSTVVISIPGPKVGLIIGKGGETVKQLQEQSGARMVIIQDGPQEENEKPLRISGDPQQVEVAKKLVYDLIAEKENQQGQFGNRGRGRGRGGMGGFGRGDGGGSDFGGTGFGPGGPGGMQGGPGGPGFGPGGPGGMQGGPGGPMGHGGGGPMAFFTVPANKCGLVIGKGGETIRDINQQTGAHCELDRRPSNNPNEKVFVIKGTPEQIDNAKKAIADMAGIYPMDGPGGPGQNAPQGWGNAYQQWGQGHPNDPNKQAADANAAAWNAYYSQYNQQNQSNAPPGGQQGQNPNPSALGPTQGGGQPDYSTQWADYYRSMGMYKEAEAIEAQAKSMKNAGGTAQPGAPGVPQQGGQQGGGGAPASRGPVANTAPAGGAQQDFSQQWIEYYRSQGMHAEADKIEAQVKAAKGGAGGPPGTGSGQPSFSQGFQQNF